MNAQPADNLNLDELTLATSPRPVLGLAASDPPAVNAAQAAFLAFGQAVEQAAPPVDRAALLSRLTAQLGAAGSAAPVSPQQPALAMSDVFKLLLTLAASLLFGMAVVGGLSFRPEAQVARHAAAPPGALPEKGSVPPVALPPTDAPGWDDLDEEISAAAAALEQLRRGSARVDVTLEGMQQRLDDMNAEVSNTSL